MQEWCAIAVFKEETAHMSSYEWKSPPAEQIERRFVETLATRGVLPLAALQAALGGRLSNAAVAAILHSLMRDGVVVRRPHRQILWYMGYALSQSQAGQALPDDIPAPFRRLFASVAAERDCGSTLQAD
jgi:hypothetical protein